jgi:hypothetical protein
MKVLRFRRYAVLGWLILLGGSAFSQSPTPAVFSRLVVVGDSLSAGVQNFSLLCSQQVHSYASVIAQQANAPLALPLVPYPGVPNVLHLTNLSPVTVAPVSVPPVGFPRIDPCQQPMNLSVPGVTLAQALSLVPSATPQSPVEAWADIVLGFPNPIFARSCHTPGAALTEIQQAVTLKPTAIIEWLGNNDALVPALTGELNTLTPFSSFATSYQTLLDTLQKTKAHVVTASIPDVTKVPYFTSVATVAAKTNVPVGVAASKLGIGPNDLLRPSASEMALNILTGVTAGPLPQNCPPPPLMLPVSTVPCVLTAKDAEYLRFTIESFNLVIFAESLAHGATFVDVYALVNELAAHGYNAGGKHLTTQFLGGIVSLDGIHPTNTGYAIIANQFIDTMNRSWNIHVPRANVDKVAAQDPLVPPVSLNSTPQSCPVVETH